jgi:hypothetical protein
MNERTNKPIINYHPFAVGSVYSTPSALATLHHRDRLKALARHIACDWGDCCAEDWAENDLSVTEGYRLLSVYRDRRGTKFWIITEADRSATTILLPDEY